MGEPKFAGIEITQLRRLDDLPPKGMHALYWQVAPLDKYGEIVATWNTMYIPWPADIWEVLEHAARRFGYLQRNFRDTMGEFHP